VFDFLRICNSRETRTRAGRWNTTRSTNIIGMRRQTGGIQLWSSPAMDYIAVPGSARTMTEHLRPCADIQYSALAECSLQFLAVLSPRRPESLQCGGSAHLGLYAGRSASSAFRPLRLPGSSQRHRPVESAKYCGRTASTAKQPTYGSGCSISWATRSTPITTGRIKVEAGR
jgi:hypothetical protein